MENSIGIELLLHMEYEWMICLEVIPPLLLAKLVLDSFPGAVDVTFLSCVLAKIADERGLFVPAEVNRQLDCLRALQSGE